MYLLKFFVLLLFIFFFEYFIFKSFFFFQMCYYVIYYIQLGCFVNEFFNGIDRFCKNFFYFVVTRSWRQGGGVGELVFGEESSYVVSLFVCERVVGMDLGVGFFFGFYYLLGEEGLGFVFSKKKVEVCSGKYQVFQWFFVWINDQRLRVVFLVYWFYRRFWDFCINLRINFLID